MIPRATRRLAPETGSPVLSAEYASGSSAGSSKRPMRLVAMGATAVLGRASATTVSPPSVAGRGERDIPVAHIGDELEVGRDVVEVRLRGRPLLLGWALGCHMRSIPAPSAIICRAHPLMPGWRNRQTRRSQKPVVERQCGFDPRPGHQELPREHGCSKCEKPERIRRDLTTPQESRDRDRPRARRNPQGVPA